MEENPFMDVVEEIKGPWIIQNNLIEKDLRGRKTTWLYTRIISWPVSRVKIVTWGTPWLWPYRRGKVIDSERSPVRIKQPLKESPKDVIVLGFLRSV